MIPICTIPSTYSAFRPITPKRTKAAASNTPAAKKVKEPTDQLFQQILGLSSPSKLDQKKLLTKIKKLESQEPSSAAHQVSLCFINRLASCNHQDSLLLKSDFSHSLRFLPAKFCTHLIMQLFEAKLESSALFLLENGISKENKPLVYSQTLERLAQKEDTAPQIYNRLFTLLKLDSSTVYWHYLFLCDSIEKILEIWLSSDRSTSNCPTTSLVSTFLLSLSQFQQTQKKDIEPLCRQFFQVYFEKVIADEEDLLQQEALLNTFVDRLVGFLNVKDTFAKEASKVLEDKSEHLLQIYFGKSLSIFNTKKQDPFVYNFL